jgi:hypothetical protein
MILLTSVQYKAIALTVTYPCRADQLLDGFQWAYIDDVRAVLGLTFMEMLTAVLPGGDLSHIFQIEEECEAIDRGEESVFPMKARLWVTDEAGHAYFDIKEAGEAAKAAKAAKAAPVTPEPAPVAPEAPVALADAIEAALSPAEYLYFLDMAYRYKIGAYETPALMLNEKKEAVLEMLAKIIK